MVNFKLALTAALLTGLATAPAVFAADAKKPPHERPKFEQLDANHDGGITLDELKTSLAKHPKMAARADKMFARLDKNKDGKIDLTEWQIREAHRGQHKPN